MGKAAPLRPVDPGTWLQYRLVVEGARGGTFAGYFAATTSDSLENWVESESNGLIASLEFSFV